MTKIIINIIIHFIILSVIRVTVSEVCCNVGKYLAWKLFASVIINVAKSRGALIKLDRFFIALLKIIKNRLYFSNNNLIWQITNYL